MQFNFRQILLPLSLGVILCGGPQIAFGQDQPTEQPPASFVTPFKSSVSVPKKYTISEVRIGIADYETWRQSYDAGKPSRDLQQNATDRLKYFYDAGINKSRVDFNVLVRLGDLYRADNKCEKGLPYLQDGADLLLNAFELGKNTADATYLVKMLWIMYSALGECEPDHKKAIEFLRAAYKLSPDDGRLLSMLSHRLLMSGDTVNADSIARFAIKELGSTTEPNYIGFSYLTLGWIFLNNSDITNAKAMFEHAYKLRKHTLDIEGLLWVSIATADVKEIEVQQHRLKWSIEQYPYQSKLLSVATQKRINYKYVSPEDADIRRAQAEKKRFLELSSSSPKMIGEAATRSVLGVNKQPVGNKSNLKTPATNSPKNPFTPPSNQSLAVPYSSAQDDDF